MTSYHEALCVGAIRIVANILMIGAIFLAMYQASHSYGGGILTFCGWFFGVTIPVWIVAWRLIRAVRSRGESRNQSFIVLPGESEPCLVHWKVCARAGEAASRKE